MWKEWGERSKKQQGGGDDDEKGAMNEEGAMRRKEWEGRRSLVYLSVSQKKIEKLKKKGKLKKLLKAASCLLIISVLMI